jgi:curved DNA-binding protein CbpA
MFNMAAQPTDPYAVLGVSPGVSDVELRRVYRELVKRHHPDHNGGSASSAALFARIQTAYSTIVERRRAEGWPLPGAQPTPAGRPAAARPPRPRASAGSPDENLEQRIARLERELAAKRLAQRQQADAQARFAQAQFARAAAARAAARAAAQPDPQARRPTQEELGIYTTDDSFTKIIDDATQQVGEHLRQADPKKQFTRRLADLFGRER